MPKTDPPVGEELLMRVIDKDNSTCLELAHTDHYTFEGSWIPQPQYECWLPGFVIKTTTPNNKTSFTVRITGHRLVCSESHFTVAMRQQIWPVYAITKEYRACKLSVQAESDPDGLTTCATTCECEGDDCRHVHFHLPTKYEDWKICEINVE